ncbi:MAG: hypothetical protein WBK28_02680, partial [Minisyncoccia bacterium]
MSSSGGNGNGNSDLHLPGLEELHAMLESTNEGAGFIIPGWFLIIVGALATFVYSTVAPVQSAVNWEMVFLLGPVWLPILLGRFAMMRFIHMRQVNFNRRNQFVLLEMRIPREIFKSPKAMESVFSSLNLGPGTGTWFKRYWWGRTRPWWSFEIASLEGKVHFFVYTRVNMRSALESFFYSQYPEIELIEAVDYARLRNPTHEPYGMFACEYLTALPDPYPIQSYVEWGLDQPSQKIEQQVDPLAQMMELMSSLGPGEQLWLQFMIRWSKGEKYRGRKNEKGKNYTWRDEGAVIVKKLRDDTVNKREEIDHEGNLREIVGFPNPTEVQKEIIAAVERNIGKPGFDVGIRGIYSAPKDKYYGTMNAFTANIFKPFISERYNQLKPAPLFSEKFNDYPWEDVGGYRQRAEMHEALEAFRARSYFHHPYRGPWM